MLSHVSPLVVEVPSGSRAIYCSLMDHLPGESPVTLRLDHQPLDKWVCGLSKGTTENPEMSPFPAFRELLGPRSSTLLRLGKDSGGTTSPCPPSGADTLPHSLSSLLPSPPVRAPFRNLL